VKNQEGLPWDGTLHTHSEMVLFRDKTHQLENSASILVTVFLGCGRNLKNMHDLKGENMLLILKW
jgi:hypothetical protein